MPFRIMKIIFQFEFFIFQFAICIFEFAVCNFQFAFLDLHFAFYGKGSCRLRQPPSNQPFFLISEMTSSIKDKAFSLFFYTKVLIANSRVSSSHCVTFCCFIPSHLLCMQTEPHILWYTKYNKGDNKILTIHIFYYIVPCTLSAHYLHIICTFYMHIICTLYIPQ